MKTNMVTLAESANIYAAVFLNERTPIQSIRIERVLNYLMDEERSHTIHRPLYFYLPKLYVICHAFELLIATSIIQ